MKFVLKQVISVMIMVGLKEAIVLIALARIAKYLKCIDLFTTRQKVVHNGGSPNFKGSLFDKKTNYLAQMLQSLSYKVCFIILSKFKFGLFFPILGTSAIMDQTACCYNVAT